MSQKCNQSCYLATSSRNVKQAENKPKSRIFRISGLSPFDGLSGLSGELEQPGCLRLQNRSQHYLACLCCSLHTSNGSQIRSVVVFTTVSQKLLDFALIQYFLAQLSRKWRLTGSGTLRGPKPIPTPSGSLLRGSQQIDLPSAQSKNNRKPKSHVF